jgi:hypothetical protein
LKTFNDQIGQRMQESDEWNAELQENNIKLEADGLRNAIIAGIGGLVLGILVPLIIKLRRALKALPV